MLNAAVLRPAVKNPNFHVLGVRVDAIQTAGAVSEMERLISNGKPGCYVTVTGMHGVAESRGDVRFREILNAADLVVPDGMPLVWLGRLHGFPMWRRVHGPELMEEFCQKTAAAIGISFMAADMASPRILLNSFRRVTELMWPEHLLLLIARSRWKKNNRSLAR